MLAAKLKQPVVQLGLLLAYQPSKGNGRPNIGQRFVCMAMLDAIGLAQQLKAQTGAPILLGPLDAIGPQGARGSNDIDQVPAAVAALPFAGVRVEEVAVEAVAGDLVVETQRVVAGATGAGLCQLGVHPRHELGLAEALFG